MDQKRDDNFTLYEKQQQIIDVYEKDHPGAFESQTRYSHEDILKRIGITVDFGHLTAAYTNLYHQDFVVEEITKDGEVIIIEPGVTGVPTERETEKTLFADMIKVGIATTEAVDVISERTGIPVSHIGYAGIKDVKAFTAQRISLRDPDPQRVRNAYPGIYLSNMRWGTGVIDKGALSANRFTLVVRTPFTMGEGKWKKTIQRVENGFYNFYYTQRFGTPRLISQYIGRAILRGKYDEAVNVFMCDTGFQDVPYMNGIRDEIRKNFGNWKDVMRLCDTLPYTFRREKVMAAYLQKHPGDYSGALKTQNEQPLFWAYAYASYLYNTYLSHLIVTNKKVPIIISLLFNPDARDNTFYTRVLKEDGITNIRESLRVVSNYVPWSKKNVCVPNIRAKNVRSHIIENGVVLSFELPPGAYATTLLSHLFRLEKTVTVPPEWVETKKIDSKKILGTGTIEKAETVLGKYIVEK